MLLILFAKFDIIWYKIRRNNNALYFIYADGHDKTGLSRTTIAQLYHDKATRVDYETIEKLCRLFDCGIADLFLLAEEENAQ